MSKVLAIDYGKKRCGFAISDEDQSIAFPLETVDNKEVCLLYTSPSPRDP